MIYIAPWKIVVAVVVVLASIVFSMPNVFSRATLDTWPSWVPSKQANLGLDLQGGAHLLLEVDVAAVTRERLEALLDEVRNVMRETRIGYTNLGVDGDSVRFRLREAADVAKTREALRPLSRPLTNAVLGTSARDVNVELTDDGQARLTLSPEAIEARRSAAVDQSLEIVRRRVDETGTKEPTIQRQGTNRILVQLPGEQDPEHIKRLLGQTAKLTFRLVDTSAVPGAPVAPGSELLPTDARAAGGTGAGPQQIAVRRQIMVSGENLVDAQPGFDQQSGQPVVNFRFDSAGGRRFGQVTTENVGKPFAIVLDGKVISAPVIRQAIIGGSGQISGGFSVQEANDLSVLLRAGALPAPLNILEERTIGPDLGADSIRAGMLSLTIAAVLVVIFMIASYGLFGVFANLALVFNVLLILAATSAMGATLTLPGIAGIVLTMGMAVDANVLIFERMREEVRAGKSPLAAIDAGYSRALSAILDANLTTLIATILLYQFGSGPVRGFAVTLTIGLIASMYTAVTLSRIIILFWFRQTRPSTLPI